MTNPENIIYDQRILDLEKKLLESAASLARCQEENVEFVQIATHDLQAPLRKLSTFAERLLLKSKDSIPSEAVIYLDKIQAVVADMQQLLDGLNGYANAGTAPMQFTSCDLDIILTEAMEQAGCNEKVSVIRSTKLPNAEVDRIMIREAFKNILDNAIKFNDKEAAAEINIGFIQLNEEEKLIHELPADKIYYKISFADNGIGFTAESAGKIFKPFMRLNGKSGYAGNGLGLAACKKIMERHNGIVYAVGNENSGATIVLILPQTHHTA
jgi:light-regulated signal transduction histidine kinase (bacteriophytochrome)